MSISHSLSNALSGMTASARMAEVVSSNVSNALTDGYGRRTLNLSAATVGGRGAGVEIGTVNRHVDAGVLADRRLSDAGVGAYTSLVSTMNGIQDIVGSAGEEGSLSSRIVAVETALIDAASEPSSTVRLSTVNDRFGELATSLNDASRSIQGERVAADISIANQVDTLNASLSQLEKLNADISYALNTGNDPSSLMDARQTLVDGIAEIVPVRELQRDGGQIALMTPGGEMLIDGTPKVFGFDTNTVITADMTLESGGLGGITVDGAPIATDGIGKLSGGTLGAAFQARDTALVAAQVELDTLAADLISRFQDPTVDPSLTAGQPGVLTDGGVAYDASNLTGLAGRISVNASVDPAQGGAVTNLRDGVNATTTGLAGDATLLNALSDALADPRSSGTDASLQSAAGRAASIEAAFGQQRITYETELSYETARWTSLTEAEAADGVDTDYELQMLLRIEQAYAANARVVQAVETLMQQLMEI